MPSKDEQLFYKLEPEGCWCELDCPDRTFEITDRHLKCKHCGSLLHANPDFSTWEGFGWLIERAKKAEWWWKFIKWTEEDGHSYGLLVLLTDPIALTNALYEYFGIEGE